MQTPLRLVSLLSCVLLVACGDPQEPANGFKLSAPEVVTAPPGASTWFDVIVGDGAKPPVTLTVESPRFTASVAGLRVRVDVPAGTEKGTDALTVRGTDATGAEAKVTVALEIPPAAKAPTRAANVRVDLNAFFYADGDTAKVVVDLGGRTAPAQLAEVVLVSAESHDVEKLTLSARGDGRYESTGVVVRSSEATGAPLDGVFTVPAGGALVAFFAVDRAQPGYADLEAAVFSDLGVMEGVRSGAPTSRVEPTLAMTDDEDPLPVGARAVGTILRSGTGPGEGLPLQLATHELVLFHQTQDELTRFLELSGGSVIETEGVDSGFASLVNVDPASLTAERLALVRALAGDTGELLASRAEALSIYGLALAYRLDGYVVAVNPRVA